MSKVLTEIDPQALCYKDIRLAFFDIDGTLLRADGSYSASLIEQIKRIQNMGIKTAVASGRPHFATEFLMADLQLNAPGVFYTGALIYGPADENILSVSELDINQVLPVIDYARKHDIYCELYTLNHFFVEQVTDITEVHSAHLRVSPTVANLSDRAKNETVIKLLVGADERAQPGVLAEMSAEFPELTFAFAGFPARPDWYFASIISQSADKKQAFQLLLDYHDLKAENVIAFGDADSDKDFLRLAGTGVALGNAPEIVQQCADYVTRPVWEDGVPYALSRLAPDK